jgi:Tfp pilus assembly protein PilW
MKIRYLKSFTLVEVLVASIVVSIILLGIITSSLSLNNNARYAAGSYYVTENVQNILNNILNNASQAYGTPDNPGFVGIDANPAHLAILDSSGNSIQSSSGGNISAASDLPSGDANTFCIHQNLKTDGTFDEAFPDANHRWVCYTLISNNLYSCIKNFDATCLPNSSCYQIPSNQPGACASTDMNYKLVGALKTKPLTDLKITPQQGGLQQALFTVTLETCLNPGDANCGSAATRSSNPYATKTGSASLPGHRIN